MLCDQVAMFQRLSSREKVNKLKPNVIFSTTTCYKYYNFAKQFFKLKRHVGKHHYILISHFISTKQKCCF